MQDYIMREINKIGQVIAAILSKTGLLKKAQESQSVAYEVVKTELLDKLKLDLDALLEKGNFAEILVGEYGFDSDNLDKFAELLFDLVEASQERSERIRLAGNIASIYGYLEKNGTSYSFQRYYILKELEEYTR